MAKTVTPCCELLDLVVRRARPNDRIGLSVESMFSLSKGFMGEVVVIRFHKDRDKKAELANATFACIEYCPFCGKKQKG